MTGTNRQWLLDRYPSGIPGPETFRLVSTPVPQPAPGQVLVRTVYLSMDPFPRLRMDPDAKAAPPLPLGTVMIGRGAGIVAASQHPSLRPGDAVAGDLGWQEYAAVDAERLRRLDPSQAPISASLHLLGSSGLAPYFALTECAQARAGETVVVSAAAGSVGLAAGQLARILGCRAVGIVRGAEQARALDETFGYAAALDGEAADFAAQLAAACPGGVDVFLDSVGGALHNSVMERINPHARIVLVGYISGYNVPGGEPPEYGRIYQVIRQRARVMGFLVGDYAPRFGEATAQLAAWMQAGRLTMPESVTQGFENVPAAFAAIFGAARPGKQLVQIAADPTSQRAARRDRP